MVLEKKAAGQIVLVRKPLTVCTPTRDKEELETTSQSAKLKSTIRHFGQSSWEVHKSSFQTKFKICISHLW